MTHWEFLYISFENDVFPTQTWKSAVLNSVEEVEVLFSSKMVVETFTVKVLLLVFVFLTPGSFVRSCEKEELVMVQMIVRHGDVSPRVLYPENQNPVELWREGLDDLTMLGKFQPFALGYALRILYDYFITSDPTEVEVLSSSDKDCFKSAQAFITSLYSPTPSWEIVQDFPFQPIYIQYGPHTDKYLGLKADCPAAAQEYQRLLKEEVKNISPSFEDLIILWQEKSGKEFESLADIEDLYNCLKTEATYNLTIPQWAHSTFEQLKYLGDIAFGLRFKSDLLKRLRGGVFVDAIHSAMEKKASGELNKTKVMVYSTHGSHLAALLSTMGMWNNRHPDPCNTVLVELYRHENAHFVRYLFLNTTTPERLPHPIYPLTVPGCTEFCPLDYVIEYTKSMIPENWEEECQHLYPIQD